VPPADCGASGTEEEAAVALLDHIAEMDADAQFNAPLGWKTGIALDHAVLHLDGAANGVDDASKLNENAITCAFDNTSVMQRDGRVEQIAAERTQPRKHSLLDGSGEFAVSGYVRSRPLSRLANLHASRALKAYARGHRIKAGVSERAGRAEP